MKKIQVSLNNGLYIVATPIGNLQDMSFRAVEVLKNSKLIICENPSHSLKLLNEYDIKKKLVSIHDYNEEKVINKISKELSNSVVSLISDSGSPLVSDPGFKLVQHCIKNKIFVTSIPGPSSIISALQMSEIPMNNFTIYGFIPKKSSQAEELFCIAEKSVGAQIFFSSPHRLLTNLNNMKKYFINRKITICKELTKINEQKISSTVEKIDEKIKNDNFNIKGEFVIIIEGKFSRETNKIDKKIVESLTNISKKFSLTDAVKIVHNLTGLSKKNLYETALKKIKNKNV